MDACCFNPSDNTFAVRRIPIPEPGPLDVRVRVSACSLNPVDAKAEHWKELVPGMTDSHVCGLDVSGVIDAVGEDVQGWTVGDAVLYHGSLYRPYGGFAEYAIHDCRTLVAHPRTSPVDAAATPCAGWTAFRALHDKLKITSADSILITGGSGGTGSFAVSTRCKRPLFLNDFSGAAREGCRPAHYHRYLQRQECGFRQEPRGDSRS